MANMDAHFRGIEGLRQNELSHVHYSNSPHQFSTQAGLKATFGNKLLHLRTVLNQDDLTFLVGIYYFIQDATKKAPLKKPIFSHF